MSCKDCHWFKDDTIVADNAGLSTFGAIEKAYNMGVSEQEAKWIPVSERLPEEGEEVLVSGYDTYDKKVIIARYQDEQYGFTCGLVSAWMPLPEPYKAESEG